MNAYDGVKYGRIGFTGILRPDFTPVWDDAHVLFKRLFSLRTVLAAKMLSDKLLRSFSHCFTYKGIRYCAVFTPIYEDHYICRIYPEEFFLKNAFSEMYDYVYSIKTKTLSALIDAKEFFEKNSERFHDKSFDEYMENQIRSYEEVFSDAGNILKLFDKSHMCEYIPIESYLIGTNDHIVRFNKDHGKTVTLETDISCPVARINYTVLESAIFLMVRILYILMDEGDNAVIKIKSSENGSLRFNSSYRIKGELDETALNKLLRILRCSLSEIGGELRFYVCGNDVIMKSSVPASLSNYVNRIRKIDRRTAPESDMFELRGIDDIFDSYEKHFVAFRAPVSTASADISALLAELILRKEVA